MKLTTLLQDDDDDDDDRAAVSAQHCTCLYVPRLSLAAYLMFFSDKVK